MTSLALAAALALTTAQASSYTDPVTRFTVTVPPGWSMLTADELAEVARRQREQHGADAAKEECRMRIAGRGPTSLPFITDPALVLARRDARLAGLRGH
jgi:hypothetical protein